MKQHTGWDSINVQTGRYREHNDCTVRAVCHAFNMSYGRAHRLLARHANRPHGKGPKSEAFDTAVPIIAGLEGKHAKSYDDECRGMTLSRFYKEYASKGGSWVVCIKGHAIGFRDGTTFDWTGDASKDYRGVNQRKTAKIGYRSAMSAYKIIDGPDPDADDTDAAIARLLAGTI